MSGPRCSGIWGKPTGIDTLSFIIEEAGGKFQDCNFNHSAEIASVL
jgi:hypothetical protein